MIILLLCLKRLKIILHKPLKIKLLFLLGQQFAYKDDFVMDLSGAEVHMGAIRCDNYYLIKKYLNLQNITDNVLNAVVWCDNQKTINIIMVFLEKNCDSIRANCVKKLYAYALLYGNFRLIRFFANIVIKMPLNKEFYELCANKLICMVFIGKCEWYEEVFKFHTVLFGHIKINLHGIRFLAQTNVKTVDFFIRRCKINFEKLSFHSCYRGNLSIIKYLIWSLNFEINNGLGGACSGSDLLLVKMLIGLGANYFENTCLHAAVSGSLEIFKFMLPYVQKKRLDLLYVIASFRNKPIKEYIESIHIFDPQRAKIECEKFKSKIYIDHLNQMLSKEETF